MPVFYIVLRRFALVWFSGFCQEIHGDFLLENGIAHIFFVFQNAAYGVRFPPMALPRGGNSIAHKNAADICAAFPSQGKQVNEPHDSGSGFIDLNFASQAALIPQKQSGEVIDPLGVSVADGPGDIFGDGSALLFGKGTHQGDKKLAGAVHGVDILFLKVDRHFCRFQAADGSEGIHGISGEPGQRLCEDQIDFSVQGIRYHTVETVTSADRQPGDILIEVKYREGAPIADDDAIVEFCEEASAAIVVTKTASDFGVHNTKKGRDLLRIPAFAFLYLLGNAEKHGYRGNLE